jgi:hypothetical protein
LRNGTRGLAVEFLGGRNQVRRVLNQFYRNCGHSRG